VTAVSFSALSGIPDVEPGTDLAALLVDALTANAMRPVDFDVLIVAQKIVSKAEDRYVTLDEVNPSPKAVELAAQTGKDPRIVELVLAESTAVIRVAPNVLIVRHRLGYVMANAGIDRANIGPAQADERVLLLPRDPDGSAEHLRATLSKHYGARLAVIISDSFGRPWRTGVLNVALGAAGLPALVDRRGEGDRYGRVLEMTEVAFADAIAAGAALVMGEGAEGTPAVLARGLAWQAPPSNAQRLIRPTREDLFR
jgi:coenzyme F420-0:L-glutamate ligase / coenzyme F420-1:gamma-L-glutamate ligase